MKEKRTAKQWLYHNRVFLSGMIGIIALFLVVMYIKGYYPFGACTMVQGDTVLAWIPGLQEVRRKIMNGESLIYSWNLFNGANFYYAVVFGCTSPFSLIYFFLSSDFLYKYLVFSVIFKILLMYVSIYLFLTKRPNKNQIQWDDWGILIFAVGYCISNAVISWTIYMPFFDCLIMLPLVLFGLERFVANKGWKLYAISLVILLLCNFYIGAMTCIFIVIYYFTLQFGSFRYFINKSIKILLISLVCVGTIGIILIPVSMLVSNGAYGLSDFSGPGFFKNWFDVIDQFLFGSSAVYSGVEMDNYWQANLYFGIIPMMFSLFYFFEKRIRINVRLRKLLVFILLVISTNESLTYYIFHLFHYTHGIPNRQDIFLVIFCLAMGAESYAIARKEKKSVKKLVVIGVAILYIALLVGVMLFKSDLDLKYLGKYLRTVQLVIIYAAVLILFLNTKKQQVIACLFAIATLVEMGINYNMYAESAGIISVFTSMYEQYEQAYEQVSEKDNEEYYRTNFYNYQQYCDIGLQCGIKTIVGFANSANPGYIKEITKYGITTDDNVIFGAPSNPLFDSLMSTKYSLVATDKYSLMDELRSIDTTELAVLDYVGKKKNIKMYRNPYALSLAYLSERDVKEYSKEANKSGEDRLDCFTRQNELAKTLSGVDNIFSGVDVTVDSLDTNNCLAVYNPADDTILISSLYGDMNGKTEYNPTKDSLVTVNCVANEDADIYAVANGLHYIGKRKKGDHFQINMKVTRSSLIESGLGDTIQLLFNQFDESQLEKVYNVLSKQQMDVTEFTDTTVKGTLDAPHAGDVFTSVPYDSHWNVYVDGKKVKTKGLQDAYLTFKVDSGKHDIRMEYKQPGIVLGASVSGVSILILILLIVYSKKKGEASWMYEPEAFVDEYVPKERKKKTKNQKAKIDNDDSEIEEKLESSEQQEEAGKKDEKVLETEDTEA